MGRLLHKLQIAIVVEPDLQMQMEIQLPTLSATYSHKSSSVVFSEFLLLPEKSEFSETATRRLEAIKQNFKSI